MPNRITMSREPIDRATSASICRAIGERLELHLGPETPLPPALQRLIDEMHRQETCLGGSSKRG